MPGKGVRPRKGIHEYKTPQGEGSRRDDDSALIENENSIGLSESESEEYEKLTNEAYHPPTVSSSQQDSRSTFLWILVPLCLIIFAGITYSRHPEEQKVCSFQNLKNEYPKEADSMWKQLKYGMEMILNKRIEKPAVYLLAHYGKQSSSTLIDKIAQQSSQCFGKKLISMRFNDFLPDANSPNDYGHVILKYKSKIKEGDVFLIANLNKISASAARAFHTICDTHSPIRKHVVIFLSLTIQQNKRGNAHSVAEQTLRELWGSELDPTELDPLITRVTDQVIVLKS